jgi:hypothetical protein
MIYNEHNDKFPMGYVGVVGESYCVVLAYSANNRSGWPYDYLVRFNTYSDADKYIKLTQALLLSVYAPINDGAGINFGHFKVS